MTVRHDTIRVWFKYPPRAGWPDQDTEGLLAVPLTDQTALVMSAPFHQEGVAPRDVVRFETDENGQHWALEKIQASGHCVVRVFPEATGPLNGSPHAVNVQFSAFHLKGETLSDDLPLITFDIPDDADFHAIKQLLDDGAASNWWQYEVACADDAWWAA